VAPIRDDGILAGRGETIANQNSFCELDSSVKDRFGIPFYNFIGSGSTVKKSASASRASVR
jgi:hypothetical protein